ncbi:MAG: hypothetical protein AAFO07_10660 [Bacteroidota bacterium]
MSNLLFLLISLSVFSFKNRNVEPAEHVFYFSTVKFIETPLSYLEGSVPLSKEMAMQRNHYRFTYDAQMQLQRIEFFNRNTAREPNHTANHFILAHKTVIEYESNKEIISFFDSKGNPKNVLGDCYRMVYQLNDLGYREKLFFKNQKGQRIENSWNIYEYRWSYQKDGSVIEDRLNRAKEQVRIRPSFEFYRLRLYFDHKGHIALMQNIDQQGNLIENATGAAQDKITTNAQGNLLSWEVLDKNDQPEKGNGPDVAYGIQTIDELGYEIGLKQYDEQKNLIYSKYGICQSKTSYDQFGNLAERWFYNEKSEASLHKNAGYHHLKISWDPSGNYRTKLAYFDIQNKPVSHAQRGYQQVNYEYDGNNNLIKISYHNKEGKLVNRTDNGIAYIEYEYDSNGKREKIKRFTKDQQIINQ